jgi:4'-phosphopantetheinyl transferase
LNTSGCIGLPDDEVHIWYASLGHAPQLQGRLLPLLSTDERKRAERFYFEADRQRSIVVRGLLRILIGRYLDIEPEAVGFTYSEFGKPALDKVAGSLPLHFNVSHSDDLAVWAFARSQPVGIDVERIRSMTDESRFAAQLFSLPESALLASLSGLDRVRAFFALWTAKEAFLKAIGMGLTIPLDRIVISLDGDGSPRLVSIDGQPEPARSWHLQSLSPVPGYQVSLAIESTGCRTLWLPVPDSTGLS